MKWNGAQEVIKVSKCPHELLTVLCTIGATN